MSDHVLERAAGVAQAGGELGAALAARARLMDLTEGSHDAALLPKTPGGLAHGLRAHLAARMSRICSDDALAHHYDRLGEVSPDLADLARPGHQPEAPRLAALVAYVDKMTLHPKEATAQDIDILRDAGVAEDDIVRLAGLVAFVNYQIRVAKVLRVMEGQS